MTHQSGLENLRDHPRLRQALRAGGAITIFLIALAFMLYPLREVSPVPYIALAVITAAMINFGAWCGLRKAVTRTHSAELTLRWGLSAGLVLSLLWAAYILYSHLSLNLSEKITQGRILTNLIFLVSAILIFGVGAYSSFRTNSLRSGIITGLWEGLIVGMVCFTVTLGMLEGFMGFLIRSMNPTELQAFAHSGWQDQVAWYFWEEEFFGNIVYFPLQVGMGLVLSIFGGIAGWLLVLLRKKLPTPLSDQF